MGELLLYLVPAFKVLGTEAHIDPGLLHYDHRIGLIVDELATDDQVAAGLIFAGPVTGQNVSAQRTFGRLPARPRQAPPPRAGHHRLHHRSGRRSGRRGGCWLRRRQDGKPARPQSCQRLHRPVTGELPQLAVTVDITTGEPPQADPGTNLSVGL